MRKYGYIRQESSMTVPHCQCCGTRAGTVGTVTFCLSGTGIVILWYHKSSHRHSTKLCIWFPSVNKFLGSNAAAINIKKSISFLKNFNCVFYGLDTEPEPQPEPQLVKSRNRNEKNRKKERKKE
jgi:hypothetical protein